ncbi:MAG: hypothetical protein U0R76_18405 [Candidatus Nanopelagicales bacterium]
MNALADTTATIAAWAAAIVLLLLVAAVFWSFLRRRGTVDGLTVESPADAARRERLAQAEAGADSDPGLGPDPADGPRLPEQGA